MLVQVFQLSLWVNHALFPIANIVNLKPGIQWSKCRCAWPLNTLKFGQHASGFPLKVCEKVTKNNK